MHRNYNQIIASTLAKETVISTLFNALVPAAIIWLVGASPPQALLGTASILPPLFLGAGMATFGMTLVLTTIIRTRAAKNALPAFDWPRAERGYYRFIPQNLFLRAVVLAGLALVIVAPAALLAVAILDVLPFTKFGAAIFNILYGAVVGLVMTRFVVLPALADSTASAKG